MAAALLPTGNSPLTERQARELVPVLHDGGEDDLAAVWGDLRARYGESLTAEKIREAVDHRFQRLRDNRALYLSESVEWYTPGIYTDAARSVLGGIDLDPASSDTANRTVRAARFFSLAQDGLAQPWAGRVWMNPPYGVQGPHFVGKLIEEYQGGRVTAAVALLNSSATGAGWFRPLWDYTLCFTYARIDFVTEDGRISNASPHGSVFAYFGPRAETFAETFQTFGAIVRRWPEVPL